MPATVSHRSTLKDLIDYKLRVLSQDGRVYVGTLLAFDAHMNLVLADCVEERLSDHHVRNLQKDHAQRPQPERRVLGLTILRGEHVLTTLVESPPLQSKKERLRAEGRVRKRLATKKKAAGAAVARAAAADRTRPRAPRFQAPPGFKKR
ncbi:AER432Cp [Eremothecium gossypii ATCC 10895]|uniref:Sm protein B n=1 Tax=Eremothecium gossypii (strain ATCC 10895 / CBS 109.51 / FGSC 9923 / NRRL Y-1056) TaxID=284811 RepID=Q755T6_EREGS|nr:AER432Cp [Eremothecium gossypii ATCC 10895]AAS53111.2 AER432Cp [Eremothecium gossypii ATCC 10895]AEY97420.1 FAER432Cp [Eremothecium gossypii FDAG1]